MVTINYWSLIKIVRAGVEKITILHVGLLWRAPLVNTRMFIFTGHRTMMNTEHEVHICTDILIDTYTEFQKPLFFLCGEAEKLQIRLNLDIYFLSSQQSLISGLENGINGRGDPLRWPRDTNYPQKLSLNSPTSGGSSVGIVRLRTKSHEVLFCSLSYTLRI
jgi:hypothetical protein